MIATTRCGQRRATSSGSEEEELGPARPGRAAGADKRILIVAGRGRRVAHKIPGPLRGL